MAAKVKIEQLSKVFTDKKNGHNIEALTNINLEVNSGELLCVLGPSGCGKTTLLRIIAGLELPSTGSIYINSNKVNSPGPDRGLVFQEFALFPWRTVAQNVAFGPEILGTLRKANIERYIELVGLSGWENKYPGQLSGGMKQRVAIARALANEPGVLLMDEPFGSLDAQTRNTMQIELLRIWNTTKKTIIFVTHSVDEAVYLSGRVVLMTQRPGSVKKILEINLNYPRETTEPSFIAYKKEIAGDLGHGIGQS